MLHPPAPAPPALPPARARAPAARRTTEHRGLAPLPGCCIPWSRFSAELALCGTALHGIVLLDRRVPIRTPRGPRLPQRGFGLQVAQAHWRRGGQGCDWCGDMDEASSLEEDDAESDAEPDAGSTRTATAFHPRAPASPHPPRPRPPAPAPVRCRTSAPRGRVDWCRFSEGLAYEGWA
ncbi:hypothetical protein DFH06DRAFT_1221719 [Mycena polygramma]|nr:hypothetical protein DFH06DRAFT_1221719 [Mycena polygramma]